MLAKQKVIKLNSCYYVMPSYEFYNHWLHALEDYEVNSEGEYVIKSIPSRVKGELVIQALKRGKGYKRMKTAYASRGSGKHETYSY